MGFLGSGVDSHRLDPYPSVFKLFDDHDYLKFRRIMSTHAADPPRTSLLARVARFSISHRRSVLLGWLAVFVAAIALSTVVGTRYASNFSLPGTDSQRATDLLTRDF